MYKCTVLLLQNGLCLMFIVGNIGLIKHFVAQDMCSLNNHVYYIKLLVACYKAESLLHDKFLLRVTRQITCYTMTNYCLYSRVVILWINVMQYKYVKKCLALVKISVY